MTARRLPLLCLAALLHTRAVNAQTISLLPSEPKHWDAAVSIGWLGGDREDIAEPWNDWYDTFATSLTLGRYWTPHVKTEIAVTLTTEGEVYSSEQIAVPGLPHPVFLSREHRYGIAAVDLSGVYQLLENRWVHPFVGAGVQLASERHRIATPFAPAFGPDGRPYPVPPLSPPEESTFDPRPFVSGGAKFYVTDTGFIKTDLSAAVGRGGAARVWWRIGGGIDF